MTAAVPTTESRREMPYLRRYFPLFLAVFLGTCLGYAVCAAGAMIVWFAVAFMAIAAHPR